MTPDDPPRRRARGTKDDQFLMALACGATVDAAAAKAGLSRRTAYRRLRDPGFRRRLRKMRDEMIERAAGMLGAASLEAVKTLLGLMDAKQPPQVRLGAARAVVDLAMKVRDAEEIQDRLQALEARLDQDKKPKVGWSPSRN